MIASGVAFRATLPIFPGVAVLVWLGSQLLGGDEVQAALHSVSSALPDSTRLIVDRAMSSDLAPNPGSRNMGSFFGSATPYLVLLIAVWSTNNGVKGLFFALNTIFDRTERRGFLRFTAVSLAFTGGALVLAIAVTALVVVVPYLRWLSGFPDEWLAVSPYLRWPVLYVLAAAALGILSRYAPNREGERWPLVTIGSLGATLVLVAGSAGFSWFVDRFFSLSVTYGSLSTAIAFTFWLWLSFAVVLASAELDAAVEREVEGRQRSKDQGGQTVWASGRGPT